jgi:hypothetical protein
MIATVVDEHSSILLSQSVCDAVQGTKGLTLVNFDSHDDLGVTPFSAKRLHKAIVERSPKAMCMCQIGTWIMPLVGLTVINLSLE